MSKNNSITQNPQANLRYSFPAFRIFVFGVEITADVGSCNTSWGDSDSTPGVSEFVLASKNDRYITTVSDIHAMYDDIPDSQLPLGLTDPTQLEQAEWNLLSDRVTQNVQDPIKALVLKSKLSERFSVTQPGVSDGLQIDAKKPTLTPTQTTTGQTGTGQTTHDAAPSVSSPLYAAAFKGDALRFPFTVGQCIFHTGDPVRIFWRDPFDATKWYFQATGTVSDWKESVEPDGRRTVTITVEDALRSLRLARIAQNPSIFDINVATDPAYDTVIRNWHTNLFVNKTLPEMLYALVFGDSSGTDVGAIKPIAQYRYGAHGKKTAVSKTNVTAGGLFNSDDSNVYIYGTDSDVEVESSLAGKDFIKISDLGYWDQITDSAVPTDITSLLSLCISDADVRSNEKTVLNTILSNTTAPTALSPQNTIIGQIITRIGENPQIYPVDNGRLLMMLPNSLGAGTNRDILTKDIADGVSSITETMTRLQIIYATIKNLDFSFMATPRGDLICEFPMYGFNPEDFGNYEGRYKFSMADTISWESHFEHDRVKTTFRCDWNNSNQVDIGKAADQWNSPGSRSVLALIPQFGVITERIEPYSYINTPEAASYYSQIKLTQANADAWRQEVSCILRMGLRPNRPLYFEARDFIATLRNVNSSIVWGIGGSVSQKLSLNYRRGWSGLVDAKNNNRHLYEPYGGYMTQTINYAVFFQNDKPPSSTKPVAGKGKRPYAANLTQQQIKDNVIYAKAQFRKVLDALGAKAGVHLPDNFLLVSYDRTPAQNAANSGVQDSFHTIGLAMDIFCGGSPGPNAQTNNRRLAQYNLTPQDVLDAVIATSNPAADVVLIEKHINGKAIQVPLSGADHVHFGLGERSYSARFTDNGTGAGTT